MTLISGRQLLGARERQEDAFDYLMQDETAPGTDMLIILADGMGGHVGGEVASRLVTDEFRRHCITVSRNAKPAGRMIEAMEAANAALRARIRREPDLAGMGSTLVAVMKHGHALHWLSVGDSMLYLLRGGALQRLNADHSVHGELMQQVRAGRMSQQEADAHPKRNALRSAIFGEKIALVDSNAIQLQPGDLVLAASDGLETLDEARIVELLTQRDRRDIREMTADLLSAVELAARARQDNATVVVYRYDPSAKGSTSTESLFRSEPAPQSWWPVKALAAGGAAVVAIGLLGLIYAIGWDGPDKKPSPGPSDEKASGAEVVQPGPQLLPEPVLEAEPKAAPTDPARRPATPIEPVKPPEAAAPQDVGAPPEEAGTPESARPLARPKSRPPVAADGALPPDAAGSAGAPALPQETPPPEAVPPAQPIALPQAKGE